MTDRPLCRRLHCSNPVSRHARTEGEMGLCDWHIAVNRQHIEAVPLERRKIKLPGLDYEIA